MTRNLITVLTVLTLSANLSWGQTGATLREATVFRLGAELNYTAKAAVERGPGTLTITSLSPDLDPNSIRIKAPEGIIISSYDFSKQQVEAAGNTDHNIKAVTDSITLHTSRLAALDTQLEVIGQMQDYLRSGINKNISGSEHGLGIDELVKTMDYYRDKAIELETETASLNNEKDRINGEIAGMRDRLATLRSGKQKLNGTIALTLTSARAMNATFEITYITRLAGWEPRYEINVKDTESPVTINFKSRIWQKTGMDWKNVRLTLSNATPSGNKVAPLFTTWFLQDISAQMPARRSAPMQNSYSYDRGEYVDYEVDEVVVSGYGSMKKMNISGSAQPVYIVDGQVMSDISHIDQNMIQSVEVLKEGAANAVYGSRAANGAVIITTKSMGDMVTENETLADISYTIDLPYDLGGDGKEIMVDMQSRQVDAEYKYYTAPRLDPQTFILAEISDWNKLNLISGKANVTFDGTYIGETYLDAGTTGDKLTLTLGTDKRVSVKREKMSDYTATRTIGNDITQNITYIITVRNNRTTPVNMVVKDQYPRTTQSNIEVKLDTKSTTPWTANKEETGVVTWEEPLAPGQTRSYQITYSVKYPKTMNLAL